MPLSCFTTRESARRLPLAGRAKLCLLGQDAAANTSTAAAAAGDDIGGLLLLLLFMYFMQLQAVSKVIGHTKKLKVKVHTR